MGSWEMDHDLTIPLSPSHAFSLESPSLHNGTAANAAALAYPITDTIHHSRKRSSAVLLDQSPPHFDGIELPDEDQNGNALHQAGRRAPGVKRACNECRQQKLRCDVQQDPFVSCSRCRKQKLHCRIEENFRRVGKRSKHAELERRCAELEHENAILRQQGGGNAVEPAGPSVYSIANPNPPYTFPGLKTEDATFQSSHEAVESLLDLKQGLKGNPQRRGSRKGPQCRTLGNVMFARDRIQELFEEYWKNYHHFLPLLDPAKPPEHYFALSELLFWTIVTIGARHFPKDRELLKKLTSHYKTLLWSTISNVPGNYHVVKALCLLCTWPLPVSSTSMDPTIFMCGLMMNIAMQIGLHRPSHAEDFSRSHIHLQEDDIRDRLKTWAACNIVAQSNSTGYGLPAQTVYDSTLDPSLTLRTTKDNVEIIPIPEELRRRLELERFAGTVTTRLYSYDSEANLKEQAIYATMAARDLAKQFGENGRSSGQGSMSSTDNPWDAVHLGAVRLHIRLYAFFESPQSSSYRADLVALYAATSDFLESALDLESKGLRYATNYIMRMMLAAAYTLYKLLNSFFAVHLETERERGCALFSKTVAAVRAMSVESNDLPQRLSEVVVQLWLNGGSGKTVPAAQTQTSLDLSNSVLDSALTGDIDDSLQLKLRTRMSMSLVYDSVWRWRDELQGKVRTENLDAAVQNPTSPEATHLDSSSPYHTRRASFIGSQGETTPRNLHSRDGSLQHQQQMQMPMQTAPLHNANMPLDQTISPADAPNELAYSLSSAAAATDSANAALNSLGTYGAGMNHSTGVGLGALGGNAGLVGNPGATIYGNSYEFFDPMSWVLDENLTGFPSTFAFMGDAATPGPNGDGGGGAVGF